MEEVSTLVDYDPFAPESMVDPRPVYERLRAAGPVHYLPKYNAWALASFEALWQVCRKPRSFTTEHRGMPPISSLLGEPSIVNFTATGAAEHAAMRRVLNPRYNLNAADLGAEAMRALAREVLAPLVAGGNGEMDVFKEYAARVAARYAAEKVGLPAEDAERIRRRAEDFFVREPGQVGTSPTNGEAAGEVFQYLQELVAAARQDPSKARGDLAVLLETEIDGAKFDDLRIAGDLFTLLITGSETTEIGVAATLYYLGQHPDQLAQVRADRSLIPNAFMETIRYDHPTDIMCREVAEPVEICGQLLEPGQQVVMLWGSASRDEDEFPGAATFDIHRTYRRHLLFGHGQHKCLGESVALRLGTIMLEEFLEAVDHYEVDEAGCQRKYAEFVQGFNSVPIRFEVATRVSA